MNDLVMFQDKKRDKHEARYIVDPKNETVC